MAEFQMLCQLNVETPMRDGVILRGDLFRPLAEGKYPALLLRTIFRKDDMGRNFGQYDPSYYVKRGFAVFIQDARGIGASDGEFDRFTADGKDGYDTVEWLAAQNWCSGNVGMIGSYFAGYLQLMAAAENPPHLRAICPMQTSATINRDCDNRGFMFYSHIGWCMSRQISRLRDGRYDAETTEKYLPLLLDFLKDYPKRQLGCMPLTEIPAVKQTPFPLLKDYYRHLVEGYDDMELLRKEGRNMDMGTVKIPAFYVSGWYDSSRTPLLTHCMQQRARGVDSRLLVAPWKPGEAPARADSALENGEVTVDLQAQICEWFSWHLKGEKAPDWSAYRYYDISGNSLYSGEEWSKDGNSSRKMYLQGNGNMDDNADMENQPRTYHHDPHQPLPYRGFGVRPCEYENDDRLIYYEGKPLTRDETICGLVRATVNISADAPDADVMMSLVDVAPDGARFLICDGATRARYREDWESRPLENGKTYAIEVLMGHTVYTVKVGHHLRLEIYGSAFPKYDANHCTGKRPSEDIDMRSACVSVYPRGEKDSCLMLPLK